MADDTVVSEPRTRVNLVFAGLLGVMALAALDQTVVATALPTVVGDLGGFEELSWVVTAYLLASTATAILWGKAGDLYGRKKVLQTSVVVFLVGSVLCGAAWNMPSLIGARTLQGIGAGGMMSLAMAAVGDLVSPRERGRYQGYIQAVFAVASVVGPLLGGVTTDHLSWRWAFYVNVPVGLAALIVIGLAFPAPAAGRPHRIDYAGAVLMITGISALQLMVIWGGSRYPWASPQIIALGVASVALIGLFLWDQARAAEPVLPLRLFQDRVFVVAAIVLFVATCSLFAAVTFLPLYLQLVRGSSATNSGLLLIPLMIGITAATTVSGRVISKTGRYKFFPIVGLALTAAALELFATLGRGTSWPVVIGMMVLMGVGFGLVTQVLVLAVQNAVDRRDLATATASANFFRSLGGSVGVAVFGATFSAALARALPTNLPASVPGNSVEAVLNAPARIADMPDAVREGIERAVSVALHDVFLVAGPIAAVGFIAAIFLPERPLRGPAMGGQRGAGEQGAGQPGPGSGAGGQRAGAQGGGDHRPETVLAESESRPSA